MTLTKRCRFHAQSVTLINPKRTCFLHNLHSQVIYAAHRADPLDTYDIVLGNKHIAPFLLGASIAVSEAANGFTIDMIETIDIIYVHYFENIAFFKNAHFAIIRHEE